ncbi:MAG: hypothetical protein IIC86_01715 [Chloroflexi bacterium]|nr:hypothetical protein [Chloroflexota bacterium]
MQLEGEKEDPVNLKACGRCGGDQIREEVLGETELVCLQCGQREFTPLDRLPSYMTVARERARRARRAA